MKKLLKIGLGTLMLLGFASLATAGMYKWVDKDGTVHYSQQPPSQGSYETMHVHTESPSGTDDTGSTTTPSYNSPKAGNTSSGSSASNVIQQTEAKGEAQRQQRCNNAKKALQTYTTFRRLRQKDGTVIRLSDTERAKRINEAKSAIREFCQ